MTRFPFIVAVVTWVGFELWLALRDLVTGRGKPARDKGSRYLISAAFYAGLFTAALLSRNPSYLFSAGRTSIGLWIGVAVMGAGIALRIWAVAALGASFRLTVETHKNQAVVERGPYKLIRHPAYSGLILICLGFGLGLQNWLSLAPAIILPAAALLYRIHIEEQTLALSIGEDYRNYQKRTKKLMPWIW
jgi:protein-S-isoprenylcysteine O-methyltransferase Ste14